MKNFKSCVVMLFVVCLAVSVMPRTVQAVDIPHPDTYIPSFSEVRKHKDFFDDPRPYLTDFGPQKVLPPELYEMLTYDVDQMKKTWAELVGFKAPDVVGKIAPELKLGKYNYKDKEKYPEFKKLMWPDMYDRFKAGEPPHGGCIPEIEIIPTRQYYYAQPIAELTKKNVGKAKIGEDGFLSQETWLGGYPFPRPAGTNDIRAKQIMYNVEKRYLSWGRNFYLNGFLKGYSKNLTIDIDVRYSVNHLSLAGRACMPPYGYFDGRAEKRNEVRGFIMSFQAPRDIAGTAQGALYYLDDDKADQLMVYVPSLRRIRKLSSTDSQDPIMGMDQIYDDNEGWMQKLSPTRYPYEFELLEEREFLVPVATVDGSEYISSERAELHGLKFERRPIYVVKLTQQDPNYVYSYRIFYIDQETFNFYHNEYYDQKGRLYRTWDGIYGWHPNMGAFSWNGMILLNRDHLDKHTTIGQCYQLPAFWDRKDISLKGLLKSGK